MTRFTLRTVPIDKIWFESRLYDPSQNHAILDAIATWQTVAETDPHASIVHHIGHQKTLLGFIYSKPTPYPDIYKMFYDIPYVGHFHPPTTGRILDFSRDMSKILGPPKKLRYAGPPTSPISTSLVLFVFLTPSCGGERSR